MIKSLLSLDHLPLALSNLHNWCDLLKGESWGRCADGRTVWFMGNLFKAAMECEERSRRMNVIKQYLLSVRWFVRWFLIKRADLCAGDVSVPLAQRHTCIRVCCLSCCFETNRTLRRQKLLGDQTNFPSFPLDQNQIFLNVNECSLLLSVKGQKIIYRS